MQSYLPALNLLLAYSGVALQIVCVGIIALLIFSKKENVILSFIKENYLLIGFLLTFVGVATSLFYSNVIGYAPCELCWLQRIFIYPSCLLFLIAYIKKDRNISSYIFWLTILGSIISLYHNYIYYFNEGAAPCDSSGVSCVQRLVSEFGGYISIPSLALTSFVAMFTLLAVVCFYKREI